MWYDTQPRQETLFRGTQGLLLPTHSPSAVNADICSGTLLPPEKVVQTPRGPVFPRLPWCGGEKRLLAAFPRIYCPFLFGHRLVLTPQGCRAPLRGSGLCSQHHRCPLKGTGIIQGDEVKDESPSFRENSHHKMKTQVAYFCF